MGSLRSRLKTTPPCRSVLQRRASLASGTVQPSHSRSAPGRRSLRESQSASRAFASSRSLSRRLRPARIVRASPRAGARSRYRAASSSAPRQRRPPGALAFRSCAQQPSAPLRAASLRSAVTVPCTSPKPAVVIEFLPLPASQRVRSHRSPRQRSCHAHCERHPHTGDRDNEQFCSGSCFFFTQSCEKKPTPRCTPKGYFDF